MRRYDARMKRMLALAAMTAAMCAAPLLAVAQTAPAPPPAAPPAPSAEMRAQFEAMHAQVKTDAYAALSADHRTRVTSIVNAIVAKQTNVYAGIGQIDALLSDAEKTAVLAVAQRAHDTMRANMSKMAPPPPGGDAMHGGPGRMRPEGGMHPDGGMMGPDAGAFLFHASLTRDQMRSLHGRAAPAK